MNKIDLMDVFTEFDNSNEIKDFDMSHFLRRALTQYEKDCIAISEIHMAMEYSRLKENMVMD